MKPATLKTQHSSGGVLFRRHRDRAEVALIAVKGGSVWCLPKGLVNKGETPEETALREVKEETGLTGKVVGKVGSITYWYFIKEENAKCKKTVDFYLMQYVSGSTEDHDWEVDDAAWVPVEEAIERASYKGDREILQKAKELMAEHGREDP